MTTISRRAVLLLTAVGAGALLPAFGSEAFGTSPLQRGGLQFEIYRDRRGAYRWRLKAANGQPIADSGQGYQAKASCREGINLVVRGAATASIQDLA